MLQNFMFCYFSFTWSCNKHWRSQRLHGNDFYTLAVPAVCLRRELPLRERRAAAEVNTWNHFFINIVMGQRGKRPMPLGYVNFTKAIFRPIKGFKLIVGWSPESSANFYSMLSRKNNGTFYSLGVSPLQYSARTSLELDFRSITSSKN